MKMKISLDILQCIKVRVRGLRKILGKLMENSIGLKENCFEILFAWAFNLRRSSYCLRKRRRQKAHHSLSMSIPERLNWQLFLIKLKMKKIYLLPFLSDMCGNGFYQHLSSSELEHIQFEFDALRFKI